MNTLFSSRAYLRASTMGVLNRVVAVGCRLLSIPLVLTLLDTERYGLWLIITSFMGWLAFVDFGIPLGLQNELIRAATLKDTALGGRLLRYAWRCLWGTALLVAVGGVLLLYLFPVRIWFGVREELGGEFAFAFLACVALFALSLPFKLNVPVAYATNRAEVPPLMELIAQCLGLVVIVTCAALQFRSLLSLVIATNVVFTFLAFASFFWLVKRSPWSGYSSESCLTVAERKPVRKQGWFFFLIVVGEGLVLQTDAFLIGGVLGAESVPRFLIPAMLFMNFLQLQNAFLRPLWIKFSSQHVSLEHNATKALLRHALGWSLLGAVLFGIGLVIFGDWFLRVWTHQVVTLPPVMAWGLAAYVVSCSLSNVLALFCNSVGLARQRLFGVIAFGLVKCGVALWILHHSTLEYLPLAYAVCALFTEVIWLSVVSARYFAKNRIIPE